MSYGHFPAKNGSKSRIATLRYLITVFPHIRPTGIIILYSFQMRVLLENTTFLLHKNVRIAGIIRVAGIIRGRALYEEIRYSYWYFITIF